LITPEKHNELGLFHVSKEEYEEAEFHFSQAAALDWHPMYSFNAGKVCAKQMKFEEAERHFKKAIHIDPNYASAHYELSLALGLQGKWEEFFKEYEWRNEYFSDLGFYRDIYSFGRKVFVCKQGIYRSFLMMPKLSDIGKE
jgi:tetratricopeptide (TPR) repeat protein